MPIPRMTGRKVADQPALSSLRLVSNKRWIGRFRLAGRGSRGTPPAQQAATCQARHGRNIHTGRDAEQVALQEMIPMHVPARLDLVDEQTEECGGTEQ